MAWEPSKKAKGMSHAPAQQFGVVSDRRYNGPNFEQNDYDGKLADFFDRFSGGDLPDIGVRSVQVLLSYKGFAPGSVDGRSGQRTINAIRAFQQSIGVAETGQI